MRSILFTLVVLALLTITHQSTKLLRSTGFQLEIYTRRNHALLELLVKEGCTTLSIHKRSVLDRDSTIGETQLEAEKLVYRQLVEELIECR